MSLAAAPAAAWLGLAALAALAWRQGLAFALSSGDAGDVEAMFFDAADNPPWLIALVAAALLFSRRRELRRAVGAPGSPLRASALLAPGLALLAWARFVSAPELALLGAGAMAVGLAWACCGAAFARAIALPIGLLAFALPAHTVQPAWHALPGTVSGTCRPVRVPLGWAPSLHRLRNRMRGVVRQLRRYYAPI